MESSKIKNICTWLGKFFEYGNLQLKKIDAKAEGCLKISVDMIDLERYMVDMGETAFSLHLTKHVNIA